MSARRRAASLGLAAASVLVALLVLEVGVRIAFPVELRLRGSAIQLPYFKEYEIVAQPGSRLPASALHTKNALGFRGAPPPKDFDDALTVIAVGGSTTECFALGDGVCWPARLGARLETTFSPLWINNAGIAGHTSQGHIELLRQHVLNLEPDVLIFLVGVNDLYFSDFTQRFDGSLHPDDDAFLEREAREARQWLGEHSTLFALGFAAYKQWRAKQFDLTGQDNDFTTLLINPTPKEKIDAELARHFDNGHFGYAERLRVLAEISRAAGALPIFMTQPAVYGPVIDPRTGVDLARIRNGVDGYDGASSWRLLESYNDVMRAVASDEGVVLVDLARRMEKTTTYYLDQVHFTAEGSERVAEIGFPAICAALAAAYPSHVAAPCPKEASGQ